MKTLKLTSNSKSIHVAVPVFVEVVWRIMELSPFVVKEHNKFKCFNYLPCMLECAS
jgi:hypothetical protein